MLTIAIIGTRGIPNHYGGFEQCAEYLASGFVQHGHSVTVYNSHNHPYQGKEWNGVHIVHCYDPEDKWGTAGQFIFDFNCIRHARKTNWDIILQLGYTSSSVWGWMLPKKVVVTTNMDGLEWKRTKYAKPVRWFLKKAEYLGTVFSDHLIADSVGIQQHLQNTYKVASTYIPYGAHNFTTPNPACLKDYDVSINNYDMLIARLEPENSIEMILDAVVQAAQNRPFIVVGKHHTKFGTYLKNKYAPHSNIRFAGGIYNIDVLNNLRWFSNLYFHGHTVGGTNPSLLEAMASGAFICAHNNLFNKSILGPHALYFQTTSQASNALSQAIKNSPASQNMIKANMSKIENTYNWSKIVDAYLAHFASIQGIITR